VRDYEAVLRTIAEQERAQKEEEQKRTIRRVRVRQRTTATLQVGNKAMEQQINPGEEFDVLGETGAFFKVEVAKKQAWVSKKDVVEIAARPNEDSPLAQTTNKPIVDESPPLQLDIDYDVVQLSDRVHIVVNEAIQGGLGHRLGLRRNDVIELIDAARIRNTDDFRSRVLAGGKMKLYVRNPAGNQRIVRVEIDEKPPEIVFGANGKSNEDGEYVVSFLEPGDSIAKRLNLQRGDKVLWINQVRIRDERDITQALKTGKEVKAIVLPRGAANPVYRDASLNTN
jgi:hypothetical protein